MGAQRENSVNGDEARLERFWNWVEDVMAEKELSFRKIERDAGVANATISKRARLHLEPTKTTYEVLSKALDVTLRDLMVHSGRIEAADNVLSDSEFFQILAALQRMTPREIRNIARYIEFQFPEVYSRIKQIGEGDEDSNVATLREELRREEEESREPDIDREAVQVEVNNALEEG